MSNTMSPRSGPRRPIVGVRISEAGIAAIDQLAEAEGVGRSEMIRTLLSEALAARAKVKTRRDTPTRTA